MGTQYARGPRIRGFPAWTTYWNYTPNGVVGGAWSTSWDTTTFDEVLYVGSSSAHNNNAVLVWPVGIQVNDLAYIVSYGQGGSVAFDDPGFTLFDTGITIPGVLYAKTCTGSESGNIVCTGNASFDRRVWGLVVVRGGEYRGQDEHYAPPSTSPAPQVSLAAKEMALMLTVGAAGIVSGTAGSYGAPYVDLQFNDAAGGKHSIYIAYYKNPGPGTVMNPANNEFFSGTNGQGYQWALKIGA